MTKLIAFGGMIFLCLSLTAANAQSIDSVTSKVLKFPSRFFSKLRTNTADINQQLTKQTQRYLEKAARQEQKMQQRLASKDSAAAKTLFGNSQQRYAALIQQLKTDTGSRARMSTFSGSYQPYVDSLQGMFSFLQKNPSLISSTGSLSVQQQAQLQGATSQLQAMQAKMQDATAAQAFIQQRKQQISQYVSLHTDVQTLLAKPLSGLNQQGYYYAQQLRQYRDTWEHPDQLEQKSLALLNKLPAFQSFMKNNSQFGSLFNIPSNYGSAGDLGGLQTRDQVSQLIQGQLSAAGAGGTAALQSSLQSAHSQLDGYKDKLGKLGAGNGDMDLPNFKPNDQKTKTFLKRLQYGFNLQTTHNNYYFPMVTDLGLSIAYKLGHSNDLGIGASYKLGWGNGIQHIALSSQGVGLRSFADIKIKNSFFATGGFEYNYTTPFQSFSQLPYLQSWTKSGLIGLSKTVSMKSRFLRQTKVSLLWDFLSYQQIPKTQPILFRVGYNF